MATRPFSPTTIWLAAVATASCLAAQQPSADQLAFFEREVRPLLAGRCYRCHGPKEQKSGLRLDHLRFALRGGSRGPALVPGSPDRSRMIQAVGYTDADLQMPPKDQLSGAAVRTLTSWIAMGAPWPEEPLPEDQPRRKTFDLWQRRAAHWAWQPLRRENPPPVEDPQWRGNPIDRFVFAALQARGLQPAGLADKATLLRRVSLDLVGLPPTVAELDAFRRDGSPDAYRRVVDRLLASPHFGEHWGRHWLDLVRFAESLGHEFDYELPNAWRYRDYVIRALNADLPYDRFVVEHLAGDLLETPRRHPTEGFDESLIATGFWWFAEQSHSPVDVRKATADRTDNQIDTFGKTFLGLTVACARCHDHKFDPIPTTDYYALAGFLKSSIYMQRNADAGGSAPAGGELHEAAVALRAGWAEELRRSARNLAPYLVEAAGPRGAAGEAPDAEQATSCDPELARRFTAALQDRQIGRDPAHPMHGFALLGKLAKQRQPFDLRDAWHRALADKAARAARFAATGPQVLADFTRDGFAGWRTEGTAFGRGPVRGQTMVHSERIPTAVHTGGWAHSNARGLAAQGVLYSRQFTIDKRYLHVLAHGRDSRFKVILEGFHLIKSPIYGQLKQQVDSTTPRWFTVDLSMWKGKRACLVLCDQSTHDLADPKRYRPDGYIAMQRACFSDEGQPPEPCPGIDRTVLGSGGEPIRDLEELAAAYAEAISRAADALATGRVDGGQARLLNWFWEKQLIPAGPQVTGLRARYLAIRTGVGDRHVPAIAEGTGQDENVFIRGGHNDLGPVVPRRFLTAIAGAEQQEVGADGSGRLTLARRLLAGDDPFPSRVMVNRLWHHLFGRGIVPTVDNFGVLGEAPSHPLLLDWLAGRFVADGWSIKTAIRRIVLSRTYRLASDPDPRGDALDPLLQWRHRMAVRRLPGEAIRDSVLRISGRLDPKLYGPSVPVHLTAFMTGRGRPGSGPLDGAGRRSVYLQVRRNFLDPFLLAFDFPPPASTMGRRAVTNVPAQALAMLNDPFIKAQAAVWARRVLTGAAPPEGRIQAMYREAFARSPGPREVELALDLLRRQAAGYRCDLGDPRPWQDLCHALWNVKEFVFVR